jgi:hypothetical protein
MRRVVNLFVGGILILSAVALATALLSTDASAASLSGTWVSRVDGKGYTTSYLYFGGSTITESMNTKLVLSTSGSSVTGTWIAYPDSGTTTIDVGGTFDGTVFTMTAYFSPYYADTSDGVFTLTVNGDQMTGSGTYLNAGVTIHGTFDLVRSGGVALGLGEYSEVIAVGSGAAGAVGVIALLIPSPKPGFRPIQGQFVPNHVQLTPSVVSETNPYAPTGPPEPGQPQGGIGITYGAPDPTIWRGPGAPPPPREWFHSVSQQSPQCPQHQGTHTTSHFKDMDDPGSWYCPHCKGYPWGGTR